MDFNHPFRVVTPTLDGDVLEVLARVDVEFTGRSVTGLVTRGSERGVRNVLERLVSQGVVSSRPAGAAKLYRFNSEHLAAPAIRHLADLRGELIRRLRSTTAEWDQPPIVGVLFGSVARREAGVESDLDLLLVRPAHYILGGASWEQQLTDLQEAATAWTGNDARVLEYAADEVRAEPVISRAIEEGIAFHGSIEELKRLLVP
jgi:predicted nucleotidyltransferase